MRTAFTANLEKGWFLDLVRETILKKNKIALFFSWRPEIYHGFIHCFPMSHGHGMMQTFYFFVISLYWIAGLGNDRCLKLIRVIDATRSIYTWWMRHLPEVSAGNGLLVYKTPEIPFVSVTNVCTQSRWWRFRNAYLFDMTTSLLYFSIHHKPCCSFLHNKIRALFHLLSPWPLW